MSRLGDFQNGVYIRPSRSASCFSLAAAILFLAASFACNSTARAGNLDKVINFDIQAETLDKALLQFGAQAHVQLSFAPDSTITRLLTQELQGPYTGKEALTKLLQGTGLRYVEHEQTVEILRSLPRGATISRASPGGTPSQLHGSREAYGGDVNKSDPPEEQYKANTAPLPKIVVTGSRLATASKEGPQEVQIYNREHIDQSGQNSIEAFISTLPSVSVVSPAFNNVNYSTTVKLRGLPIGTTLVLLDGRRLEGSGAAGGQYFDLSTIPLAAVQRVEVDQNGSSAVYGSDAIAGVVNIILKKDFSGFATDATYEGAKDIRNVRSSFALGKQWLRGGFSVIGSYETAGGLLTSDRRLSASNDYTTDGGPDNNYPDCFAGNVFSRNGGPLPGAPVGTNPTYAAITGSTVSGTPNFSQFTYGKLNECSYETGVSLFPSTEREAVLLQGQVDIGAVATLFTEVAYTHLVQVAQSGYSKLFGTPGAQSFTVSALNPFNPFGKTVGVAESLQGSPITQNFNTDFFRPLVGIRGTLAGRWSWEISGWQSVDWTRVRITNGYENVSAIQGALNSASAATALNPFVIGSIGSQTVLQPLFSDEIEKKMGRDRSVEAFIRGVIFRLPAGDVQAVLGGDYIRSNFYSSNAGGIGANAKFNSIANDQRRYDSAFGEARIPLISGWQKAGSNTLLAVTISGRHDRYDDFGGDTTEQMGLEVRPMQSLLLRGTYGTAFSAPALQLLHASERTFASIVKDPSTGHSEVAQVVTGGNPALKPNTGHSNTAGGVYVSQQIPGLRLSVTQWHVVESNVAQAINTQIIIDNAAAFPGRVVLDSAGNIVEVNDTEVNFGRIDVSGLDYGLGYKHHIDGGILSIDLDASETYHYSQALVPGGQSIESVGRAQSDGNWAPRWKGTVGLGWSGAAISYHVDGRYTGSYVDYVGNAKIGNFWVIDANVRWLIGRLIGADSRYLTGTYIEAGATNLLNRAPQFSNFGNDFFGYDAAQMSIVGRSLYVSAGVHW